MAVFLIIGLTMASSPQDMAMQVAQEGTLIGWHAATLEPRASAVIEALGDPCFRCYTRATEPARRLFAAEPKWIAWAMRHRDPAIRFRAGSLVPRCAACNGDGDCPDYASDDAWPGPRCRHCHRPWIEHRKSDAEGFTVYCKPACAACGGTGLGWGGAK